MKERSKGSKGQLLQIPLVRKVGKDKYAKSLIHPFAISKKNLRPLHFYFHRVEYEIAKADVSFRLSSEVLATPFF